MVDNMKQSEKKSVANMKQSEDGWQKNMLQELSWIMKKNGVMDASQRLVKYIRETCEPILCNGENASS
jgi:hypothetical protein